VKATFDITLIVPKDRVALSNMVSVICTVVFSWYIACSVCYSGEVKCDAAVVMGGSVFQ